MITFQGGRIDLDTFNHENMHQWWGDNVTEANYNLTFFKEGMATLGEYLFDARNAATSAGGLDTPAGHAAFDASLVDRFNTNYANSKPLDRRALRPDAGHAVLGPLHLHPSRHRVHRAAANPRQGELRQRATTDPARLSAAPASPSHSWRPGSRRGCQTRARHAARGWTSSSPSGSTPRIRRRQHEPAAADRARTSTGSGFYNADGTCG